MSRDLKSLTVGGKPFSITALQKGIPELMDALEAEFVNKVCCGLTFPDVDKVIDDALDPNNPDVFIYDNLREPEVGYNFVEDPRNPFVKHQRRLLDAIMSREFNTITGKNKLYKEDNGLHFDMTEMRHFFNRVDDFIVVSSSSLST